MGKTNYTFMNGKTEMRVKPHWKETIAACDELFGQDEKAEIFIEDDRMAKVVAEMSEVKKDYLQFNHHEHDIAINFKHRRGKGVRTLGMKSYEQQFYQKRLEQEEQQQKYHNMSQYSFYTGYNVELFINEELYKERVTDHTTAETNVTFHGEVEAVTEEVLRKVVDKLKNSPMFLNYDRGSNTSNLPGVQSSPRNVAFKTARQSFDSLISVAKKERGFPEIKYCLIYNPTIK